MSHDLHGACGYMTTCFHFCIHGSSFLSLQRLLDTIFNLPSYHQRLLHLAPDANVRINAIPVMVSKITFHSAIKNILHFIVIKYRQENTSSNTLYRDQWLIRKAWKTQSDFVISCFHSRMRRVILMNIYSLCLIFSEIVCPEYICWTISNNWYGLSFL